MSRSYREPIYTCGYGTSRRRMEKRIANRAVRHASEVPDGKAYRRLHESYKICDYKMPWTPGHFSQITMTWVEHEPIHQVRCK